MLPAVERNCMDNYYVTGQDRNENMVILGVHLSRDSAIDDLVIYDQHPDYHDLLVLDEEEFRIAITAK